jgi:hypothetical protein
LLKPDDVAHGDVRDFGDGLASKVFLNATTAEVAGYVASYVVGIVEGKVIQK